MIDAFLILIFAIIIGPTIEKVMTVTMHDNDNRNFIALLLAMLKLLNNIR